MPKGSIRNPGTKTAKSKHDGVQPRAIKAALNKESKWQKDFSANQKKRIEANQKKKVKK